MMASSKYTNNKEKRYERIFWGLQLVMLKGHPISRFACASTLTERMTRSRPKSPFPVTEILPTEHTDHTVAGRQK